MTLKEKFGNLELDEPYIFMCESDAEKCEQIVDNYAIEFAEWICEKAEVPYIKGTMDKTLEVFKKEKGYE